MRVIILAGGYGTRLQQDLQYRDPRGEYRHLLGVPKALLPIGHRPLISHWMETLRTCRSPADEIYVVCNDLYVKRFDEWSQDWPEVRLFTDGTTTNETRSGAVACINIPIEDVGFEDDVTVIGGDTLFYEDFNLSAVWEEFGRRKQHSPDASLVLACPCTDEETLKVGILETDGDKRVTAFLEKPGPDQTPSRKSCPCFYIFSKPSLPLIKQFLEENKNKPLKDWDATGHFIRYLYSRLPVYTFDISARFDVGALTTYNSCHQYFLGKDTSQSKHKSNMLPRQPNAGINLETSKPKRLPATYVPGFHDDKALASMRYNKFGSTGLEVSAIGLGGSPFGSVFSPMTVEAATKVVYTALQSGINYIDTAPFYGDRRSEAMLGKVLKDVPREAYYIATKVGRYKPNTEEMFDFSAERTLSSVDESLRLMGLDYVDVIQVHDLEFAPSIDVILNECLPALERIKKAGKAKFIGITGYPLDCYKAVLERSCIQIDVVLSYCHLTLFDSSLLDLLPYFKEKGLGVVSAAPVGMGLLSDCGPKDWHPAGLELRRACRDAALYCRSRGVNIAKLAMHHAASPGGVDLTLVGMETDEIVASNVAVVNGSLTDAEKATMEHVMERFFRPLEKRSWEGVELDKYWSKMRGQGKAC